MCMPSPLLDPWQCCHRFFRIECFVADESSNAFWWLGYSECLSLLVVFIFMWRRPRKHFLNLHARTPTGRKQLYGARVRMR
jgi:hypothetical protein